MINGRKIVTICGSTRFAEEYRAAAAALSLEGKIVLTVGMLTHALDDEGKGKVGPEFTNVDDETKEALDRLHLDKIRMSDEIYVLNKNGYIGDSTAEEIALALALGISIKYRYANKNSNVKRMSDGEDL